MVGDNLKSISGSPQPAFGVIKNQPLVIFTARETRNKTTHVDMNEYLLLTYESLINNISRLVKDNYYH